MPMWSSPDVEDGHVALLKDEGAETSRGSMLSDNYAEYVRLRNIVEARLETLQAGHCNGWNEEIKIADSALDEMESNCRKLQLQLSLELSGVNGNDSQMWEKKFRDCCNEVTIFRGELQVAKQVHARRDLRLPTDREMNVLPNYEKQMAQHSTEMLERCSQKLEAARSNAIECENMGTQVLNDLAAQRETILHARGNMGIVGVELNSARRTLGRMIHRAQQNQLLAAVIAIVLGFGLAVWAFCILGLPLKWTLLFSVILLVSSVAYVVLRNRRGSRRWQCT